MENELALGFELDDSVIDRSIAKLKEYDRLVNKISASSRRAGRSMGGGVGGGGGGGGSGLGQIASYSMMNSAINAGRKNQSQLKLINDPVSGVMGQNRKLVKNVTQSVAKNNSILQSQVRGFARVQAGNIGRRLTGGSLTGNLVASTMQRGLAGRVGSVIGSVLGLKIPIIGPIIGAFVGSAIGDGLDKIISGTGDWWKENIRGFTKEQIESHKVFNQAMRSNIDDMQSQFSDTSNSVLREFKSGTAARRREILEEKAGGNILPGLLNRTMRRIGRLTSPVGSFFIDSPEQATDMARMRQSRMESAARRELAQREEGMNDEGFMAQQEGYAAAAIRRMLRP